MNTMIKTALLTTAALVMTAGVSVAAPAKHHNSYGKPGYSKVYKKPGINAFERRAIARSAANLAQLKRRVWRDGKLSPFERIQLRNAERRHAALVARAYRS
jgi:hypothetical protein